MWAKGAAIVAAIGLFIYGFDHWALVPIAFGWVLRGLVAYFAWILASDAFRDTKTPWRTARKAALGIVGIAAFAALTTGGPWCDDDGYCDEYDGPPINLEGRVVVFAAAIAIMGIPTLIAGYRYRVRFPKIEFNESANGPT